MLHTSGQAWQLNQGSRAPYPTLPNLTDPTPAAGAAELSYPVGGATTLVFVR
jgi:hypothetical protein